MNNQFDPYTNYGGNNNNKNGGNGFIPSAPSGPSPNQMNGRPSALRGGGGFGGNQSPTPQGANQLPPLNVSPSAMNFQQQQQVQQQQYYNTDNNNNNNTNANNNGNGNSNQFMPLQAQNSNRNSMVGSGSGAGGGGVGIMTSSPQYQQQNNNNPNNASSSSGNNHVTGNANMNAITSTSNSALYSGGNNDHQNQMLARNQVLFQQQQQNQQRQNSLSNPTGPSAQPQQQSSGGGGMNALNYASNKGRGNNNNANDPYNFINTVDTSKWRLTDLDMKETLGTGTFGRVRLCKHKMHNKFFALKIIKKQEIIRMKQVDHILSEAAILKEIRHPFIVNMVKGFADEDRLYLLMELVVGGEMFSHLRKAGKFPNDVAKFYCCEVLLAFEYLHERQIIYRDLKPENILLDEGGHVKIADFGFAKKVTERTFTLCGTPEYIAPEVIQSRGHGKAVDYWALGILLYEMIVGYPPFFDESPFKTYEKILEGKLQFPKWVDARARDIVRGLLTADHTKRLGTLKRGMQDLKKHKYFAGVDWEVMLTKKIPAPIPVRVARDGDSRYFDRYPESPPRQLKALTPQQQDLFKGFCNGEYGMV